MSDDKKKFYCKRVDLAKQENCIDLLDDCECVFQEMCVHKSDKPVEQPVIKSKPKEYDVDMGDADITTRGVKIVITDPEALKEIIRGISEKQSLTIDLPFADSPDEVVTAEPDDEFSLLDVAAVLNRKKSNVMVFDEEKTVYGLDVARYAVNDDGLLVYISKCMKAEIDADGGFIIDDGDYFTDGKFDKAKFIDRYPSAEKSGACMKLFEVIEEPDMTLYAEIKELLERDGFLLDVELEFVKRMLPKIKKLFIKVNHDG